MTERTAGQPKIYVGHSERVASPLGGIIKTDIIVGGDLRTLYSGIGLSTEAATRSIIEIQDAEQEAARQRASGGKNPTVFVEAAGAKIAEAWSSPARLVDPELLQNPLSPLARQKAYEILYREALDAQANPPGTAYLPDDEL